MRDGKSKLQSGKLPLKAVAIVALVLLALSTAVVSVDAHMPGAKAPPEFELEPIVISDAGTEVEITIEDLWEYHEGTCICMAFTYRATLLGISEIWGEEIPARDDIRIISSLPTPGSRDALQYLTGTAPGVEAETRGEYKIILPDGTEVTNMTKEYLKKLSKERSIDNYRVVIHRISTDESFDVALKEGIFPEGFFELRKKVKFDPKNATDEEKALFNSQWEETRDKFLTLPDWELFEGVEEPEEEEPDIVGGAIFFSILVIGAWFTAGAVSQGESTLKTQAG